MLCHIFKNLLTFRNLVFISKLLSLKIIRMSLELEYKMKRILTLLSFLAFQAFGSTNSW
jgi:hypothetical protein